MPGPRPGSTAWDGSGSTSRTGSAPIRAMSGLPPVVIIAMRRRSPESASGPLPKSSRSSSRWRSSRRNSKGFAPVTGRTQGSDMTYCVGMELEEGLVLMSDTRTNSRVDNISVFRNMFHWAKPDDRVIAIMTAGNLATTQAVISNLEERTKAPADRHNSLFELPTMFQVAGEAGKLLRETVRTTQDENGMHGRGRFAASLILAGQIKGMEPRLFLIYPEGNFIEADRKSVV